LTSLQQRLVKTGGPLVKHSRYYPLLLAESHLTERLFGAMPGSTKPLDPRARGWCRIPPIGGGPNRKCRIFGFNEHLIRNEGAVAATGFAVQLVANGAPRRIDEPAPETCLAIF
jgi:hypothetical protein